MKERARPRLAAVLLCTALLWSGATQSAEPLRVCADSRNLPLSDSSGRGFENVLAQMIASDLRRPLEFVWRFRRGSLREDLAGAGRCSLVLGVPVQDVDARLTAPYYRSSYVFVTRADRHLDVHAFADAALRHLRIGVYSGNAAAEWTPPGRLAAAHGLSPQVRAFRVSGGPLSGNPAKALIDALAAGEIDVGVGWGPILAYFAARASSPMTWVPVDEDPAHPDIATQYSVAMAVPPDEHRLQVELEDFLSRHRAEIRQLLADYHVPLQPLPDPPPGTGPKRAPII